MKNPIPVTQIEWNLSNPDRIIIEQIVERAGVTFKRLGGIHLDPVEVGMDITATHLNGCRLDLQKLLDAPNFDFIHDVSGIARHIDRDTGKLTRCFLPRCAAREVKA